MNNSLELSSDLKLLSPLVLRKLYKEQMQKIEQVRNVYPLRE